MKQGQQAPFHGYYFRILTKQGAAAKGGARDYVVNGQLTRGFALVAYPAEYRNSGVMTFIVNQDGVVYEKDLGPDTAKLAAEMSEYNPDSTWIPVGLAFRSTGLSLRLAYVPFSKAMLGGKSR